MNQDKYNQIKPLPPEGAFFMNFPGVYCKKCEQIFALYSYSAHLPNGVDENGKPYYKSCLMCVGHKEESQLNQTVEIAVESPWFGSVFPSDRKETFVEVFSQEGDPAFVSGLYGCTNGDMIEQIEKDLNDNRDFMEKGDGRYLYQVAYQPAQVGDEGRIELPAYWDLSLVAFLPN